MRGGKRIGSGRKRLPEGSRRETLSTRMHPSAIAILKRLAKARGVSAGDIIEMLIVGKYK